MCDCARYVQSRVFGAPEPNPEASLHQPTAIGPENHGDVQKKRIQQREISKVSSYPGMLSPCAIGRKDGDQVGKDEGVDAVREFSHCIHVEDFP